MLVMESAGGLITRPVTGSSSIHTHASNYGATRGVTQGHKNALNPMSYSQQAAPQGLYQNGGRPNASIQGARQQGLFPPMNPGMHGGNLPNGSGPTNGDADGRGTINIMNRRADKEQSLYQICLNLKERLRQVPGFEQHIKEMEDIDDEEEDGEDPVSLMWRCFKLGFPLMTIYNALKPEVPLEIDPSKVQESKMGKAATFKFLQGCLTELEFPAAECFLITDLYGNDTTGFVKVTKVVNRVLDLLGKRGQLYQQESKIHRADDGTKSGKHTQRQHIVGELVTTERDYVQHLESLQQFKKQVEENGAIPGDAIHDIFLNLNALLDFQRRFLIRIEKQNSLPEAQQNWGRLFTNWNEPFRGVYEPFIANQKRCNETVIREWEKLRSSGQSELYKQMVENERVLLGFLLKPFQRLSKYPLLLDQLIKDGGFDNERQKDLQAAAEASRSVLLRANAAMDREQRLAAVNELSNSVEDWKGHKMEQFGELLLYGNFTVLKGDGAKDVEREVRLMFDVINSQDRAILPKPMTHIPIYLESRGPKSVSRRQAQFAESLL
ncbi:MAG: hypothetical protein M1830_007912 [Pleopsidium flavum]|nr:MAG: hypothetical protein M1830_007912 [Pleopsidium flavum]